MIKIAKIIPNLFENYKPKELKISKIIDVRFHKEPAWKKEQFKTYTSKFYISKLIKKFKQLFSAETSYSEGNPLKKVSKESNLSIFVIKRVAKEILARESMYKILKTHIGYKGEFGLNFTSLRLKMYQYKNKKLE